MGRPVPTYTVADIEPLNAIEFDSFTTDDAVDLGLIAVELIRERDLSLAVDIVLGDDLVFRAKLKDTDAGNNEWLAGKAAVVRKYGEPSLLVKLRAAAEGVDLVERDGLDESYRLYGGSLPIRVGGAVVATLTLSGEPDAIDHETAAEALERYRAAR
jgi:uncharacterized protein (UPF0303 family)